LETAPDPSLRLGMHGCGGCAIRPLRYCPNDPTNRAAMAVFLPRTFGLP
jgi:hypothetical protein